MIKATLNNGDLVFGLSEENIKRLKAGQPIAFNLKDMGLEERRVLITYGETEEDIYKEMTPYIVLDKTKIHL
jgi:predicted ThiF/HesA family dinucleotide-utilizing enzyme